MQYIVCGHCDCYVKKNTVVNVLKSQKTGECCSQFPEICKTFYFGLNSSSNHKIQNK